MIELTSLQMLGALPLFSVCETHQIARSCCLGHCECRMFADRAEHPTAAVVVLQRFGIGFVAGDSRHAAELLEMLRDWHPWYEIADPPEGWYPALADWSREGYATIRYGFTNDPESFDRDRLCAMAVPPEGCEVVPYDRALLEQALGEKWSEDQMGCFVTPEGFLEQGLGMAVVRDGKLLAGCASFCRHADGYEIQVDTNPDQRGKGLATCACAAFILAALSQGMKPYWDAANSKSLRLAQKLGFTFSHAFPAWMLIGPKTDAKAVAAQVIGEE